MGLELGLSIECGEVGSMTLGAGGTTLEPV